MRRQRAGARGSPPTASASATPLVLPMLTPTRVAATPAAPLRGSRRGHGRGAVVVEAHAVDQRAIARQAEQARRSGCRAAPAPVTVPTSTKPKPSAASAATPPRPCRSRRRARAVAGNGSPIACTGSERPLVAWRRPRERPGRPGATRKRGVRCACSASIRVSTWSNAPGRASSRAACGNVSPQRVISRFPQFRPVAQLLQDAHPEVAGPGRLDAPEPSPRDLARGDAGDVGDDRRRTDLVAVDARRAARGRPCGVLTTRSTSPAWISPTIVGSPFGPGPSECLRTTVADTPLRAQHRRGALRWPGSRSRGRRAA